MDCPDVFIMVGQCDGMFFFAIIGIQTSYIATFKFDYDEYEAFVLTAKNWGYPLMLSIGMHYSAQPSHCV